MYILSLIPRMSLIVSLMMVCPVFGIQVEPPAAKDKTGPTTKADLREADNIIKLKDSLKSDWKKLKTLQEKLQSPSKDFLEAEKAYTKLNQQRTEKTEQLEKLKSDGKATESAILEKELQELEKDWQAAKNRFGLLILERKTVQDEINALQEHIASTEKALNVLQGKDTPENKSEPDGKATTGNKDDTTTTPTEADSKTGTPTSSELLKAQETLKSKQEEVKEAEKKLSGLVERVRILQKNIDAAEQALNVATLKAQESRQSLANLKKELEEKRQANAPPAEVRRIEEEIRKEESRVREAEKQTREAQNEIAKLQASSAALQAEQSLALQEADKKRKQAEEAQRAVSWKSSPLHPQNIWRWFVERGPKMIVIILGVFGMYVLVSFTCARLFDMISRRVSKRKRMENDTRVQTMQNILRQSLRTLFLIILILMILDEMGFSIQTLLGGAAVAGLAVSFAAQNMIKDYFAGFMILSEDQYAVGDIIKIADITGTVEKITTRITVVRDLEAVVHFIPNGSINAVSNMTHTWSRALFELGVAYREDTDRVIEVIKELSAELRSDSHFHPMILKDVQILGVDAFADSAVIIKFFINTKPSRQWEVKRELLRRIKRRFDELGIEIPFPQRTLHFPSENGNKENGRQSHSKDTIGHQG